MPSAATGRPATTTGAAAGHEPAVISSYVSAYPRARTAASSLASRASARRPSAARRLASCRSGSRISAARRRCRSRAPMVPSTPAMGQAGDLAKPAQAFDKTKSR
ncbi:hypothetical protein [Nonomuraea glycinis]|uniref:hypothetical protein n=1 Tax=Nonomuraea glycinis TaxID=2047744 RepID=UPI003899C30D